MNKRWFAGCLLVLGLFGTGPRSVIQATTVERLSLEALTQKARSIVVGTVQESRTFWTDDRKLILTTFRINVQESLKGKVGRSIEVTTLGGRIGDVIMQVSGTPVFRTGEQAVVFVEQSGKYLTILGLQQGKFSISQGQVSNTASDLVFSDGMPPRAMRMTLEVLKSRVHSILSQ